jgi:hypothetical protein
MKGFGARYYDEDTENYSDEHDTNKSLIPDVIIGGGSYVMESSTLDDIAKHTGVTVNKDDQASWICLKSEGVNYWFISDNEMGQGDLTAIGIAAGDSNCKAFKDGLKVSINDVPLLNASKEKVSSYFSNKPKKDIIMYCNDTKVSGDYIRGNCVQYYLKGAVIQGLFISQLTTS